MYDSPLPLRDYCLDYIRDTVKDVLVRPDDCGDQKCTVSNSLLLTNLVDSHLTSSMSEQLLESLSDEGKLNDDVLLEVFRPGNCSLENVRILDAAELSMKGLRVLRGHKIQHLEVVRLEKITISELIDCLGEWTLRNLFALNVSRSSFISAAKFCVLVDLAKLQNLRCLDVSHTEFNHHGLKIVVEDLPALQSLNISATRVRDLTPLRKCRSRLKCLSMYNLRPNPCGSDFAAVLCELNNLIKLDISDDRDEPLDHLAPSHRCVPSIIERPDLFPYLKYLDISGNDGIDIRSLKTFIDYKHQLGSESRIEFLGLMQTDLCNDDVFLRGEDEVFNDIVVTGIATEKQILQAMQTYSNRPTFVQKSLCYLYNYTINTEDERADVIDMILPVMRKHSKVVSIQMAATACLYNLTKAKVGEKIHPKWLSGVVGATLNAMEHFPTHQQLQKNTLLTLCSDRILQEVTFDRYKCTRLVMESLVNFNENSMNRMAVAICSILAAKISTSETSCLGAKPVYMATLLMIVSNRLNTEEPDIMLKFTLSALWNLTDESPRTCSMFLEKDGIKLYLECLRKYVGYSAVETKILGLLNNIAEVPDLRRGLMSNDVVIALRSLLHSDQIDVSYFAAGIFSHLISDGVDIWTGIETPREEVISDLLQAVLGWKAPDIEMVAYRSFSPFLPLLGCFETPEVQVWACWAIHHVCSKNPKRYCEMLLEHQSINLFKSVTLSAEVTNNVPLLDYCKRTLEIIRTEYPHLSLKEII